MGTMAFNCDFHLSWPLPAERFCPVMSGVARGYPLPAWVRGWIKAQIWYYAHRNNYYF